MPTTRIRAERLQTVAGPRWYLDETSWIELPDIDPLLERRLDAADGWSTGDPPGTEAKDEMSSRLLALFEQAGLAVRGHKHAALSGLRIGLVGAGPLARAVARDLLRGGATHLLVHAPSTSEARSPVSGATARGLVNSLHPRPHVRPRAVPRLEDLLDGGLDVVVVAGETAEPDRLLLDRLVRGDLPHLVVGCGSETARLGPMVLPGHTPCLTCCDLHRAVEDPAWPQVLGQLMTLRVRPDPLLVEAVAARTVLELGWMAADLAHAARLAGRCELFDVATPQNREARFPVHPDCGCAAAA